MKIRQNSYFSWVMQSAFRRYLVLLTLAIAGIVVYRLVPFSGATQIVFPSVLSRTPVTFSDSGVTGTSQIILSVQDTLVESKILLDAPMDKDCWAGFGWNLKSNWSFMDTLFLEVRAEGFSELQLYVLTFDPDHSINDSADTYRQLVKEFPVSTNWQRIAVPAEQFYIPDWWYAQQGVDRSLDNKHLESVRRISIQPSARSPRGVPLRLELRRLEAVGASNRNQAILLGYLFLLTLVALGTNPNWRRKF